MVRERSTIGKLSAVLIYIPSTNCGDNARKINNKKLQKQHLLQLKQEYEIQSKKLYKAPLFQYLNLYGTLCTIYKYLSIFFLWQLNFTFAVSDP